MKSEFSFNVVSTETIKRIINDLGIKKACFGEIDFILDNFIICVNEALKKGSFPDNIKCANVRSI